MSRQGPHLPPLTVFERSQSSGRHFHSQPDSHPFLQAPFLSRRDQAEDSMGSWEKTTSAMLDQALHINHEIASSLRRGHSNGGVGQAVRQLLEEHIHIITAIVSRLNRDIEVLQEQTRMRAGVTHSVNPAPKAPGLQSVSTLSDLRGRIARCDASIARLSADIRSTNNDIQVLHKEKQALTADLRSKIKDIELQISVVCSRLEQSVALQEAKTNASQAHSAHQLHLLDTRLNTVIDELKGRLVTAQHWLEKEQEKAVQGVSHKIEQLSQLIKNTTENKDKNFSQLSAKLNKMEEMQINLEFQKLKHAEEKINARIIKIEKDVQDMRAEMNAGFTAIHESLSSLRQVLEAKMQLEKEQLQKQIRQLKRLAGQQWQEPVR
ncbi:protein FAM81A [Amia ocellicauda]|uniref:protein FAM81A n=1 Tax=Amia ocellicauda TaxID=2972642 RepID=UPI0034646FD1